VSADDVNGLAAALAERALTRATLGAGLAGAVLGAIALGFLLMAGSRLDALTTPVVALAAVGQVAGLTAAARCALGARGVRAGHPPRDAAAAAQRFLRGLAALALGAGAVVALVLLLVLDPLPSALLGALLGFGLLAQAVVVITVVRGPLGRAARAPRTP
jgi:hypothetical protein